MSSGRGNDPRSDQPGVQADDGGGTARGEAVGQCAEGDGATGGDRTLPACVWKCGGGGCGCNRLSICGWLYFLYDESVWDSAGCGGGDVAAGNACSREL